MIAGPNGSGKSTLKKTLEQLGGDFGSYLNADDIAASMRGDPESVSRAAQEQVRLHRDALRREFADYCWEMVMSHPSHIDHLRDARAAGYETRLIYVATEHPRISVDRVRQRVALGGHDVPTDRIIARYERSIALLPAAIDACDTALIYDNSDLADAFRLICVVERGDADLMHRPSPEWFDTTLLWLAKTRNMTPR